MNAKRAFPQILCMLAVSIASANATVANATVAITLNIPNPSQVSQTNSASVHLDVSANTNNSQVSVLTVGGGYTLTCQGGLTPVKSDTANSFSNPGTGSKTVSVSGSYVIDGYANWQNGSQHLCTVQYRGRAAEGATGTSGAGFDFVFQVGSLVQGTLTDTKTFYMRKYNGGGCNP